MNDQDKVEFAKVWTAAYQMYSKEATKPVLSMAFNSLRNYSIEDIRRGLSAHMRNPDTGQYAPKPADVIKHIGGNSQSAAGEAWAKVDYAVRCVGPWRSVVFDDPKIHAALERLGGWQKVANTDGKEYPHLQNHFLKLYQGFTVQPPATFPCKLIGTAEHENSLSDSFTRGRQLEEPALIGNPEKARSVYQGGSAQGVAQISQKGTQQYLETIVEDQVQRIGGGAA